MRYYSMAVRLAIIKKVRGKYWWGCGEKGILMHFSEKCKLVQSVWKTGQKFFKNLKNELPSDPAIPLLDIYLKKMKTGTWRNICSSVFILELFMNNQDMEMTRVHQQMNG